MTFQAEVREKEMAQHNSEITEFNRRAGNRTEAAKDPTSKPPNTI